MSSTLTKPFYILRKGDNGMLYRNGNGDLIDEDGDQVILNDNCSGGPTLITDTGGYYYPGCSDKDKQKEKKNQNRYPQTQGGYW